MTKKYESADPSNIVIIENFISKIDVRKVYNYCYLINEWESQSVAKTDKICSAKTIQRDAPDIYQILLDYLNIAQSLVEYRFGRKLEPGTPGIRRWDVGESQGPHADGESDEGVPSETYIVDYGLVMYLNDDYEGGEIYFPAYDICFRPEPGTLIFFPSSPYYIHGVHPITGGIRYTSPHFWVPVKHNKLLEIAKNKK